MKNYTIKLIMILGLLFSFSCEDFLDQAPETSLSEEDVFSSFNNAQGFVEEMYSLVVSYEQQTHTFQDYLLGDDGHVDREAKISGDIDNGDLFAVISDNFSYFFNHYGAEYGSTGVNSANVTNNNAFNRQRPGLWDASLRGIRKANIIIENIDLLINASQAERDVILGQAYFFRAFFHNEIMKFWGRFPYITEVYVGVVNTQRPETYKESALAANEDYKRAIDLLPFDWDNEAYGRLTAGDNKNRINKMTAYAFQGKNLLLAASPLMFSNNQGGLNTYQYDTELCDMAVDAFAEVLKSGKYSLATWENYDEVFWKSPTRNAWPGGTEFIFAATGGNTVQSERFMTSGVSKDFHNTSAGFETISPTHNYIYNNFGMANGLSIEDDLSGQFGASDYNPNKPFDNRDPRFDRWHITDGDLVAPRATGVDAKHQRAQLWRVSDTETGIHRRSGNSNIKSTTGYMRTKFYPIVDGEYHSRWNDIIDQYVGVRLHMRYTDVYLMYAEALHASKGATTAPLSHSLTAEAAINELRQRAGMPDILKEFVGDNNKFMDELRRERAVELCYEAHRWLDIRRWGVAHLEKYKQKTALNFPENHATVGGYEPEELVMRVCEYPKHYWLPFEAKQTQIYEGFPQNPGW
ncbi:RagB/SusD family nutrient uptake outer membrane protein [uncultured Polaribacter sp.]|uniref:RagB/SusD family nutrient uptake outer membrane protein n=1 Tax=uncultured Polaribacter sp. TaxID=174711 RepID=UPI002607683B|nr:RagB/SusD family nutrient uptake outer membrane protein [uncultured Polaribacter sp.]